MGSQTSSPIPHPGRRLRLGPYWLAFLATVLGLLLRFALDPWLKDQMPYITFLVSVAVTGLYAGVGPSLFSTTLGAAFAYFCFVPPRYQWGFAGISDAVGFLAYLSAALGIVVLTRARNKAYAQAENTLQQRISTERKLRDAESILHQFLENRPGCAYLRNDAGQYVYCNNQARTLLGISEGSPLIPNDLCAKLEKEDRQVLEASGGTRQFVDKVKQDNEERYWLTTKFIFIDHGNQRLVGSLSLDITTQMRAEQVILERERLAAASQMVATVAHEINNPLAAVTSSIFLLSREPLSAPLRQLLAIAQDELTRLTRISGVAIGFYKETEHPSALNPCALVDEVVDRVKLQFPGDVQIQCECSFKGDFVACPGQLRRALENLLINSFEAGAHHITVRVEAARDWRTASRTGVRFTILDDGRGMEPEQLEKAFEFFFSTKAKKGAGLGLWIARVIALRNGGRISLRSSTDPRSHYTYVSIFLPDSSAAAPALSFRPDEALSHTRHLGSQSANGFAPHKDVRHLPSA
ncbi:MAG TPA: ATP-binding protein [Candidatus Acidoferrales bacterium]|nr:ATP-binding protein [Candidatus Acidoferrales bacterium]